MINKNFLGLLSLKIIDSLSIPRVIHLEYFQIEYNEIDVNEMRKVRIKNWSLVACMTQVIIAEMLRRNLDFLKNLWYINPIYIAAVYTFIR